MWDWIVEHSDSIVATIRAIIEIAILWFISYQIYHLFKATRGAKIMLGLLLAFLGLILVTALFKLTVIWFVITYVVGPGLGMALVVIFQPELRMGLAKLGSNPLFSRFVKMQRVDFLDTLCKAVEQLSKKRYGALFAIEREISLKGIQESGVKLDALFSPELALSIFFPKTALHDGGVIISNERIESAGCVFPVTSKEMSDRTLGLRHRAAVGISEESDAIVVIVSEETGAIAIARSGKLERNLTIEELKIKLEDLLHGNRDKNQTITD